MKPKTILLILLAIIGPVLLANCTRPQNNAEDQGEIIESGSPGFVWRSSNPIATTAQQPFFAGSVELTPPTLCNLELSLDHVSYPEDGQMTMFFSSNSGEIPAGEYAAQVEGQEGLYFCEIIDDQLACTGPALPPGTETTVQFGQLATDQFANLLGGNGAGLSNLWSSKSTVFDAQFDFQLVGELAQTLGINGQVVNLQDAYRILGTYVSFNGFPGFGEMESSRLLLSSYPQFRDNGLVCDDYLDCAKQCADVINYDLKPDDLVGAFDFYKNYVSRLGSLLPEACQAFNQYAEALEPSPGSPQFIANQWLEVSNDRFDLYNPAQELFELYDVSERWQNVIPDLTPQDLLTCAQDIGWPYSDINDTWRFLNHYFNYFLSVSYIPSQACTSEITRAWIEAETNNLSGNAALTTEPSLNACAAALSYEDSLAGSNQQTKFLVWLMELWSDFPTLVPAECSAMWASEIPLTVFENSGFYNYFGYPQCTDQQSRDIQQALEQFRWEVASCGDEGQCEHYDSNCQEIAFVNSLLRDGVIDGPSSCQLDLPSSCLAYSYEQAYVPTEVWACAIDTCWVNLLPLQRGEGVYGLAQQLNMSLENNAYFIPNSCKTSEVITWIAYNKDCASEDYADSSYEYSQCGTPYNDDAVSGYRCYTVNGANYCMYEEFGSAYCPSCSTVYECAEGNESIFCGETPEDEDPGYWGQLNQCAGEIAWGSEIATYQDGSDLISYLITAAPFLPAVQIPPSCQYVVSQTLIPGTNYGDFLTGITLGGTVQGSSVCSEPIQVTIPEETVEEEFNRCALFDDKSYSLTMLDIQPNSTALTLYVSMSGGVPGLETLIPEDQGVWEYSAVLGSTQALNCSFQGYANRLYCSFSLPETYLESIRPLDIYVNGCAAPIYSNTAVSIIPLEGDPAAPACVQPPYPDPQNACWIWNEDLCQWECIN